MKIESQKYTLSLPKEIYEELRGYSMQHGVSIKDVVRQCLKFGLIAMKVDGNPNKEIIFREREPVVGQNGQQEFRIQDTRIKFVW